MFLPLGKRSSLLITVMLWQRGGKFACAAKEENVQVIALSLLLLAATILIHYEALRVTSLKLANLRIAPRMRIIVILVAALASHLAHITLYAGAFLFIEEYTQLGTIEGPKGYNFSDAFYFSITSYTTLGIGDLYPTGAIRLLSGVEALNGLVMVGWTASMTYLAMERFWQLRK